MRFSDLSVLHVEDKIIVAIETASVLADLGFGSVRVAHTLGCAESLARTERFDLALLDVNLGNGEGTIELGIALRERGTHVVFASGYNKCELSARLQNFDFIEKPLSRMEIEDVLLSILTEKTPA